MESQVITDNLGISAVWVLIGVTSIAVYLFNRLLSRLEDKLDNHDEKLDKLNLIAAEHELRISSTEKAIDKWAMANTQLADTIITKIRAAQGL